MQMAERSGDIDRQLVSTARQLSLKTHRSDPKYASRQAILGVLIGAMSRLTLSANDLDDAIERLFIAVEATPSNDTPGVSNILGTWSLVRWSLNGSLVDLDYFINTLHNTILGLSPSDPSYSSSMFDLAERFSARHTRSNSRYDLYHAIELVTAAIGKASQHREHYH